MPPKKVVATSSDGTSLTPGETKMLAVVCALMGDVPQVNFETVAQICGIKYGKNARQSCKRLFKKIKDSHPEINIDGSAVAGSGSGAEEGSEENEGAEAEEGDAPKRAGRGTSKAPKATGAKKTVGKTVAPKKAAAAPKKAPVKKASATKSAAKAVAKSESDDADGVEVEEEAVELMDQDEEDGNVPLSASDHLVAEALSTSNLLSQAEQPLSVSTSVAVDALTYFVSEELHMHINGYDYLYCNQDIIDAQLHGITLEHFILWKFENGVDRATVCGR
ncbi:hypothetical protein BKA65DRAFT_545531 [Rhexocercosporidium sp. MPI-PUGE-AT-0058]|nr:hypothetical protein BKA65DRAFT_545531 [Rhexocercosporidium sp. MPI-PUGE-AT-0058]